MKIHEINIYQKLKSEPQSESALKSILKTHYFKMLVDTEVISRTKSGRGATYQVIDIDKFEQFLSNHFTEIDTQETNRITSAVSYHNSKYGSKGEQLIFLRGFKTIEVNEQTIDLQTYTRQFGVFSTQLKSLKTPKICYIENLKCFLIAEQLLGQDYVYLHPYGRPSEDMLQKIKTENLLFFPDYDYTGLNDFLRCKKVIKHAELYLPNNYQIVIKQLAKKEVKNQIIPKKLLAYPDEAVMYIVSLLQSTNLFLEQEVLFYER